MADVYGPVVNHWKAWLTYSVTQNPGSVTVTVKGGPQAVGWGFSISNNVSTSIGVSWTSGVSGSGPFSSPTGGNGWNTHCERTFTIPKDHYNYTGYINCTVTNRSGYMNGTSTASASFSCPAKNHCTVSYNANGGTGAPAAQTKWYGEVLSLSSTKPTRTNYSFQGWSTSASGSVQYAPGARFGYDTSTTLYAVWKLDHKPPQLSGVHAERCASDGTANDEGAAFHVSANYSGTPASNTPTVTGVAVKWRQSGTTEWTSGGTVSCNATSGSIKTSAIASGKIATDKSYDVLVTATDSNGLSTSVQTGVGPSYYTMDILANGKGVAFGRSCSTEGIHFNETKYSFGNGGNISHTFDGTNFAQAMKVATDGWRVANHLAPNSSFMPGIYSWLPGDAGAPVADTYGMYLTIARDYSNTGTNWVYQIAKTTSSIPLYVRQYVNTSGWSPWRQVGGNAYIRTWTAVATVTAAGSQYLTFSALGINSNTWLRAVDLNKDVIILSNGDYAAQSAPVQAASFDTGSRVWVDFHYAPKAGSYRFTVCLIQGT